MEMEDVFILMETYITVSGKIIWLMDQVLMNMQMEENISANGKKINNMGLDKKPGITKNHMKETLRMERNMETEY